MCRIDEIERLRLQLAAEQIIDDELYVGDPFRVQKRTSGIEQTLVDVPAHDLSGGAAGVEQVELVLLAGRNVGLCGGGRITGNRRARSGRITPHRGDQGDSEAGAREN